MRQGPFWLRSVLMLAATLSAHEPATLRAHGSARLHDDGGARASVDTVVSPGG